MRIPPVTLALGLCALSMGGCSPDDAPTAGPAFPNPRAGFPSNGRTLGYIANQYADTISVLDLGTLAVLGEVPVGINPVELDGPAQVRLDPTRGVAYVLLTYPLSVVGAHAVAHGARPPFGYVRELSLLDLTPLGGLPVDRRAASLALSADHSLAAVVHFDQDLALLPTDLDARRATLDLLTPAWDLQTGTANKRAQPVCVAPLGVVLGGNGARAFVACTGEDSLAVVDTNSLTVLTRVPAGDGPVNKPTAIVVDPAGQQVLLSNQLTSQVVAFDANDTATELLSSVELPGLPGPVAFLSAREWLVPLQSPSGAVRVDAATGQMLTQKSYRDDECQNPHAATIAADGTVFMVCEGDHYSPGSVVRLDPVTLDVQARAEVGLYPDQLAILPPANTATKAAMKATTNP